MATSINESIWKTLITTIIPLCLGTLIFGMMIESYKNELNFRGDIMKDYYSPLVEKQRECIDIGESLSGDYNSMAGNYVVMLNQYKLFLSGQAPRLTEEFKNYLQNLLVSDREFRTSSEKHTKSLAQCKDELHQSYINVALVTGTLKEFKLLEDENNNSLNKIDSIATLRADELREELKKIDLYKVLSSYFISGDPGDKRNDENDNYTQELLTTKVQPLVEFFSFASKVEKERNAKTLQLSQKYNEILESEISSRYKRNWFSKTFF